MDYYDPHPEPSGSDVVWELQVATRSLNPLGRLLTG